MPLNNAVQKKRTLKKKTMMTLVVMTTIIMITAKIKFCPALFKLCF